MNSFFPKSWIYIPAFFIATIFFFLFKENKKEVFVFFLFLLAFSAGTARNFQALQYSPPLMGDEAVGIVSENPEQRELNTSFILETEKGKISIFTEKYFKVEYGDKVKISGKIMEPEEKFRGFYIKDGIRWISFYPDIEVVEKTNRRNLFFSFKEKSIEKMESSFSSPYSSILMAMLLGERSRIPSGFKEKLSVAGVRHITAVSGMHVAVVSVIFSSVMLNFGFTKRKTLVAALLGILIFVLITGGQSSAIRAGIMGGSVLCGRFLGRKGDSLRLLVFAAAIMLSINPFLLRYDIGFQLSFAAVSGIVVFAPFFEKIFKFLPENTREIMKTSFSAQVFSFPLLGYYFKEVSLVFPLTNLLILPILYWVMLLGIVFIFFSLISEIFAGIFSFSLWLLLAYLVGVVEFFAKISWATIDMGTGVFLLYLFFLFHLFKFNSKVRQNSSSEIL